MFNTFKYVALSLIRDKGILVWSLAFPIILSTCFMVMFAGLDTAGTIDPVPAIVVEDENYENADAFKAFIQAVSGNDVDGADPESALDAMEDADENAYGAENAELESITDNVAITAYEGIEEDGETEAVLDIAYAADVGAAKDLLWESVDTETPYVGYITVDENGSPELFARNISSATGIEEVDREILLMMLDTYQSKADVFETLAENNPYALMNPQVISSAFDIPQITERISVTYNPPKESVRYYFALMGMAALFGAQSGLIAVIRLKPDLGPLGARRELGATSHASSLAGTIAASWAVSTVCLLVAFAYIRFVVGVDFAGRDAQCILAIAASSLMATSLGAFLGSLPKISSRSKIGFLTIIVCLATFFAGLYGQPTMEIADTIAKSFPLSQYVNPAVQISQTFYSIMYYDNASIIFSHIDILLIFTVVLFMISLNFLRKQRYASL